MKKLAVFASGSGTNLQAIIDGIEKGFLAAELALVVCDQPDAYAIERAKEHGIDIFQFRAKEFPSKEAFEKVVLQELQKKEVEWIALAGYMRLIGTTLLTAYAGKIVNIHPSLLPSFPGKHAIEQAFAAKVKITGVTIHFVDSGMDTGPIIAQEPVFIEEEDTIEIVRKKIQEVEHRLYPTILKKLVKER